MCVAEELGKGVPVSLRIPDEDLVAFRDLSGNKGLLRGVAVAAMRGSPSIQAWSNGLGDNPGIYLKNDADGVVRCGVESAVGLVGQARSVQRGPGLQLQVAKFEYIAIGHMDSPAPDDAPAKPRHAGGRQPFSGRSWPLSKSWSNVNCSNIMFFK